MTFVDVEDAKEDGFDHGGDGGNALATKADECCHYIMGV